MRAIVVGFPKAGTTTLQKALTRAGLRCAHQSVGERFVGKLVYDGWFEHGDPFAYLTDFDALTQMDVCRPGRGLNHWPNLDVALLLAIRDRYPDCTFILNSRAPAAIADSVRRWSNLQPRLAGSWIAGLPAGRGGQPEELVRWIEAHHTAIRRIFAGDPAFLDLDIAAAEAPQRLGAALGIAIPWWGVANANRPAGAVAAAAEAAD